MDHHNEKETFQVQVDIDDGKYKGMLFILEDQLVACTQRTSQDSKPKGFSWKLNEIDSMVFGESLASSHRLMIDMCKRDPAIIRIRRLNLSFYSRAERSNFAIKLEQSSQSYKKTAAKIFQVKKEAPRDIFSAEIVPVERNIGSSSVHPQNMPFSPVYSQAGSMDVPIGNLMNSTALYPADNPNFQYRNSTFMHHVLNPPGLAQQFHSVGHHMGALVNPGPGQHVHRGTSQAAYRPKILPVSEIEKHIQPRANSTFASICDNGKQPAASNPKYSKQVGK